MIEEEPSSFFSEDVADETDVQSTIKELNNSELPFQLNFFLRDEEDKNLLIDTAKQHVRLLNDSNEVFLNYLSSTYGSRVLKRNKMKIHIKSANIHQQSHNGRKSLQFFTCATRFN